MFYIYFNRFNNLDKYISARKRMKVIDEQIKQLKEQKSNIISQCCFEKYGIRKGSLVKWTGVSNGSGYFYGRILNIKLDKNDEDWSDEFILEGDTLKKNGEIRDYNFFVMTRFEKDCIEIIEV